MLFVNVILFIATTWAAGTMRLTGEVHGFTTQTIQISDGQHIYTLSRDKISNKVAKNLKRGELIDVTVDFEGVLETEELKKKK